ncbi:trafficking protein particle complex 1 [Trichuris trichiura]|uniref:Trafficking protein particle complex subunit n=1 Tax=Trichuris trichiura TaxID=36087 RepID=A0A077Z5L5_TRITR|nr:trafficking protein particle complex 1 [Trichuris trichiura]
MRGMTIYNLYIFHPQGHCIGYYEWHRPKRASINPAEEFQLVHGLLTSVRSFNEKLSPLGPRQCSVSTMKNRLHYFETATSLKFVMNTDLAAFGIEELLPKIYEQVYVPYVTGNPLAIKGELIQSEVFKQKLSDIVQSHASFA